MAAPDADLGADIAARVHAAARARTPLAIRGSGSKRFMGAPEIGDALDVSGHCGIIDYAPDELVITARAGTRLADLEAALNEHGQMLAFEPPHFGADATLGGTIAAGLSGPRRANAGAARDFVLGVRIVDGRGEILRFGGQVIKNVAGYDVSRLMAGAFGTLGVLLDVSLKLLPRPSCERTLMFELAADVALERIREWTLRALPISASAIFGGQLAVRLSGTSRALDAAAARLGGEVVDDLSLWATLREQTHAFFSTPGPLWRMATAPAWPLAELGAAQLIEWHGAQRWLRSDADPTRIRAAARAGGGYAQVFRGDGGDIDGTLGDLLTPAMLSLHRRIKQVFDLDDLLNRGRLFATDGKPCM